MIECRICNKEFKRITGKHLKMHGISSSEYKEKYPGSFYSAEEIEKYKLLNSGSKNPNYGEVASEKAKKNWMDPEYRDKVINGVTLADKRLKEIGYTKTGKKWYPGGFRGKNHKKETKDRIGKSVTEKWKDPEYAQRNFAGQDRKPNRKEIELNNLLELVAKNQWKYIGDGKVWINGRCPDFININGKKQIIELFGDYWHKGQNPQNRIDIFAEYGYKTLVIWEYELGNKMLLKEKIQNFI